METQTGSEQGAKAISTVITKLVVGALGTEVHFYIQLIVLLFKVEFLFLHTHSNEVCHWCFTLFVVFSDFVNV